MAKTFFIARYSRNSNSHSGMCRFDSKLELTQFLMAEGMITADFRSLVPVICAKVETPADSNISHILRQWDYGMPGNLRFI